VKLDPSAFVADSELIQALQGFCVPIACEEDRTLFRQGDMPTGLYILRKGNATLTMTSPLGDLLTCTAVQSGSLLGLPGLIGNRPYTLTAMGLKGSDVCFVTREDFSKLMLTQPSLSLMVLRVLAAEVRTARNAISEL
jgi:CRP-like cAMP-binding protein